MPWNWQLPDWPHFTWDSPRLLRAETLFARQAGIVAGALAHLEPATRQTLLVDSMRDEALDTSAIEGELLDRASLQSSIRRHLGLQANRDAGPAEAGIAELMVALHHAPTRPLDHETLFAWHRLLMKAWQSRLSTGRYRSHPEPMQIVSGPDYKRRIHFEAPPSDCVEDEMTRLLAWLERTAVDGPSPLPPLARAGIAHLWFECIHPFEDGNGRIGRAIVEYLLVQSFGQPLMTGVAGSFLRQRKAYYRALEAASRRLDATDWLLWFAAATIEAARRSEDRIAFVLDKARLLRGVEARLNTRQMKALLRMFEAGPEGFIGGLSAANYRAITGTSTATATRDLSELVVLGALLRTGSGKGSRYHLAISQRRVEPSLL